MGFWSSTETGGIAQKGDSPFIWGDGFADIIDAAIIEIRAEFEVVCGRPATDEDVRRGLIFATADYSERTGELTPNEVDVSTLIDTREEQATAPMETALQWVCGVIDECNMDTKTVTIQELLDVLFDLKRNMEDEV